MDDFRKRARDARKRLKKGFWEEAIEEKKEIMDKAVESGQDLHRAEEMAKRKIAGKIQSMEKKNKVDETEELYKKVCKMMDEDTIATNPLAQLIDYSVFDNLDDNAKQVYILKLSTQYSEMKKRYNSEHGNDFGIAK